MNQDPVLWYNPFLNRMTTIVGIKTKEGVVLGSNGTGSKGFFIAFMKMQYRASVFIILLIIVDFSDTKIHQIFIKQRITYFASMKKISSLFLYLHQSQNCTQLFHDMMIAANPSFIRSLKIQIGERQDYYKERIQKYQKSEVFTDWERYMTAIPVLFAR